MQMPPIVSQDSPVCLIGGAGISKTAFEAAKQHAMACVAVDSGADFLLAQNVAPLAVIGDLDSLSDKARRVFADRLCHIAEQATTDFEKALMRVSAPCLIALGFTGGRLDHLLAVLNALLRYPAPPVVLLDDHDASFVARPGTTVLMLDQGTRISVMPVADAAGVSLSGVVWPFSDQMMTPDGFSSPSNAALGGAVTLQTAAPVLVTLPQDQLAVAVKAAVRG